MTDLRTPGWWWCRFCNDVWRDGEAPARCDGHPHDTATLDVWVRAEVVTLPDGEKRMRPLWGET